MKSHECVSTSPSGGPFRVIDVSALLFDSDGVLVDSDETVYKAWRTWALERHLDPTAVLHQVHGRRSKDTVAALVPRPARAAAQRRIDELEVSMAADVRAMPGARALLDSVSGMAWAVVTSATRALATARLHGAGLPIPPVLVTADDVAAGKPAPDGYRLAALQLGCLVDRCVVFEDSAAGVLAGRAAAVGYVVGVNLRSTSSPTWARVRDLSSVACNHLEDGRLRVTVRAS